MASISAEELKQILADQQTALTSAVTNSVNAAFDAKLAALHDRVDGAVARVDTLEQKITESRENESSRLVAGAKREFDTLTREMFHESGLVLTKPASSRATPANSAATAATPSPSTSAADVQAYVESVVGPGKYSVEPMKVGFRLVHNSRSPQIRRNDASELNVEQHRRVIRSRFGLSLSLDRPYLYRTLVRVAYDFLDGAKKACPAIRKVGVSKGFCFVNSLPIGPVWLVPANKHVWMTMYDVIARDLGQMPSTTEEIGPDGFFGPLFKHAFVRGALD